MTVECVELDVHLPRRFWPPSIPRRSSPARNPPLVPTQCPYLHQAQHPQASGLTFSSSPSSPKSVSSHTASACCSSNGTLLRPRHSVGRNLLRTRRYHRASARPRPKHPNAGLDVVSKDACTQSSLVPGSVHRDDRIFFLALTYDTLVPSSSIPGRVSTRSRVIYPLVRETMDSMFDSSRNRPHHHRTEPGELHR